MEYAVVTLRTKDRTWEADMELPAKLKLKNVAEKVLDTIKAMDESRFEAVHKLRFIHENRVLDEDTTLADHQIWDGGVILLDW